MLKMMNEESWEWLREYIISEKVILVLFIVVMSGLWLRVTLSIIKGMVLIHRSKHDLASRLYRFEMITKSLLLYRELLGFCYLCSFSFGTYSSSDFCVNLIKVH